MQEDQAGDKNNNKREQAQKTTPTPLKP